MGGLTNVQMPEIVLASIYKGALLISDDIGSTPETRAITEDKTTTVAKEIIAPPTPPSAKHLPAKWFLGDNANGFVIIVKDEDNVYLDETKLQLLSSILSACKMNLADVAIVNHLQTPVTLEDASAKTTANHVLAFGVNASELQVSPPSPMYQMQQTGSCKIIFAPDLAAMTGTSNEAKLEKSKLWVSLKGMFQI